jgi:hypothetical protein
MKKNQYYTRSIVHFEALEQTFLVFLNYGECAYLYNLSSVQTD